MFDDVIGRPVDDFTLRVASDGSELGGEPYAELRGRADQLSAYNRRVVDRDDRRRHCVSGVGAGVDRALEIGEGLGRHKAFESVGIAGGESMNDHVIGAASAGQKVLRREAAIRAGNGVEAAPDGRIGLGDAFPALCGGARGAPAGPGARRRGAIGSRGRSESWRMPSTERSFKATNSATSANMTVG